MHILSPPTYHNVHSWVKFPGEETGSEKSIRVSPGDVAVMRYHLLKLGVPQKGILVENFVLELLFSYSALRGVSSKNRNQ